MRNSIRVRRQRRRVWLWVLAGAVLVQCVTVTPSIEVTYVDEQSGAPLVGLPVTAVWQLQTITPAGGLSSRVLKVEDLLADSSGVVRTSTAVLLHPPLFPFSLLMRDVDRLPVLYAAAEAYEPMIAFYDGFAPDAPFLPFHRADVAGTTQRLARTSSIPWDQRRKVRDGRDHLLSDIFQARAACQRLWMCQNAKD